MNLSDLAANPLFKDKVIRNEATSCAFWICVAPFGLACLFLLIVLVCLLFLQFSLAFKWFIASLLSVVLHYPLEKIFTPYALAADELKVALIGKFIRLPSIPSSIALINDVEVEDAEVTQRQNEYACLGIIEFRMKVYSWYVNKNDVLELRQEMIKFKSNDKEKFKYIGSANGLGKYFVEDWEVDTVSSPWRALSIIYNDNQRLGRERQKLRSIIEEINVVFDYSESNILIERARNRARSISIDMHKNISNINQKLDKNMILARDLCEYLSIPSRLKGELHSDYSLQFDHDISALTQESSKIYDDIALLEQSFSEIENF